MKLTIGENIRNYRKKNDLTQEALADRLGVTYQSVSRWENGSTYPDLELIPAIAELLSVTVDELLGMPQIEKERRALEAYDELRRECMKREYDADKIISLLRDIRRNHLGSDYSWRPWSEGNDRAFRDPKILPEVRLLAEAYLERHPMHPHVIETMAEIEDEENLDKFFQKHTTPFDCSARTLLFNRYLRRNDSKHYEPERRYQLHLAIDNLLCSRYWHDWNADAENMDVSDELMEDILALVRRDAEDDRPDMWVTQRLELGFKSAARAAAKGNFEEAILKATTAVELIEEAMKITDEILLPTSCRFLDGMEWRAKEVWRNNGNNPDSPKQRMIYIYTEMSGMTNCYCLFPCEFLYALQGKEFDPLRDHPEFIKLCKRIEALIITEQN